MRRIIGDKEGDIDDEMAVTVDPARDKVFVMEGVSVAMPRSTDCAVAAADTSARLEIRYEGTRNTPAAKIAMEMKKRRTMKNLT